MALVSTGWKVSVTIVDAGADKVTRTFETNPAVVIDYTTAVAAKDALVAALDGVSNSLLYRVNLYEQFVDDTDTYAALGENENLASVVANIDDAEGDVWDFQIPNPITGLFLAATGPDRNNVDLTATELDAFGALFDSGTGHFVISDGEGLKQSAGHWFKSGKRIHRKSRKG